MAARQELRGILQRLSAIPREQVAAVKKYAGDQGTVLTLSQCFAQENSLLSRQAAELIKKLPADMVSSAEYAEVALTLQQNYQLEDANVSYQLARKQAGSFADEINAVRSLGNLAFLRGDPKSGRVRFQEALDIFRKYPVFDPLTQVTTQVLTQTMWAASEAILGLFPAALEHNGNAATLLGDAPFTPGVEMLRRQVADQRAWLTQAAGSSSQSNPAAPPPAWQFGAGPTGYTHRQ